MARGAWRPDIELRATGKLGGTTLLYYWRALPQNIEKAFEKKREWEAYQETEEGKATLKFHREFTIWILKYQVTQERVDEIGPKAVIEEAWQ